jgi:hypothetical protein
MRVMLFSESGFLTRSKGLRVTLKVMLPKIRNPQSAIRNRPASLHYADALNSKSKRKEPSHFVQKRMRQ